MPPPVISVWRETASNKTPGYTVNSPRKGPVILTIRYPGPAYINREQRKKNNNNLRVRNTARFVVVPERRCLFVGVFIILLRFVFTVFVPDPTERSS